MKLSLTVATAVSLLAGTVAGTLSTRLVSEFYMIPFPEDVTFTNTFRVINGDASLGAVAPMTSIIALSISADNTIVWIDHWEDGFETDITIPTKNTTEIWGDGNASNGCVFGRAFGRACTNADDILKAGDSVVINNLVPIPRNKTSILYDGGDVFASSLPIAITRGCYPDKPGSLLAGAVEVLEMSFWNTVFEAPLGQNVVHDTSAYELTQLYIMAGQDGTDVTLPDLSVVKLNKGQNTLVRVNQGAQVKSTKKVQVDLVTADIGSNYETRWYSLLGVADWSNQYVTSMGDTVGKTKVTMYNPNSAWIKVTCELKGGSIVTYDVEGKKSLNSNVIEYGSGAIFTSANNFFALSQTDTGMKDNKKPPTYTAGQIYDWGFPLMPRSILSSQVLVGWGWGCTFKNCTSSRSAVFITPLDDATIYVDYNNDGLVDETINTGKLESLVITDTDLDMSGAIIFATRAGTGPLGTAVDLAACWGQNPLFSGPNDINGLDLGTVVLPFPTLRVSKHAEAVCDGTVPTCGGDGIFPPGSKVKYTIRLVNVGQRDIAAGTLKIVDPLLEQMVYIAGSTSYASGTTVNAIVDNPSGTKFPLDGEGIGTLFVLPRRGGSHEISFLVNIVQAADLFKGDIVNQGYVNPGLNLPILPFTVTNPVKFDASIAIEKTVYLGQDGKKSCITAVEEVTGPTGTWVTYCFKVTNIGTTYLNIGAIEDKEIPCSDTTVGQLAPGTSVTVAFETQINKSLKSNVTVTAKPIFQNWAPIPNVPDVSAYDPAGVKMVTYNPAIKIAKTVYLGDKGLAGCSGSTELVTGNYLSPATYCYVATNTGAEYLGSVVVTDPTVSLVDSTIGSLSPGQSKTLAFMAPISGEVSGDAKVVGNPTFADGSDIPTLQDVMSTDPAGVKPIYKPSIDLQKTVYEGDLGVDGCSMGIEMLEAVYGTQCTYCYKVTNTGLSYLTGVKVADTGVGFKHDVVGSLAPGEFVYIATLSSVNSPIKSMANTIGRPALKDLSLIPNAASVTDTDDAGVNPRYNPSVKIDKTVKLGVADAASCMTGSKELIVAAPNSDITYCYKVINTGDSFLNTIVVDDVDVGYKNTSIPTLPPNGEGWLAFQTKLAKDMSAVAKVTANPVHQNTADIVGQPDVTSNDGAAVQMMMFPAIDIEKTVKPGHYGPETCSDGKEMYKGQVGAYVTYCYVVTNIGNTPLKNVVVSDPIPFQGSLPPLQPGESKTIVYQTKITKDILTNATAKGQPADQTGANLVGYGPVSAIDDAGVDAYDLQLAMEKPTACMQPAFADSGATDSLICNLMDVYIEPESITPNSPKTCEDMSDVVLSIKAALFARQTKYDVGWYVATDGGDALTGTCVLNGLNDDNAYNVVSATGSTTSAGHVSFTSDAVGGNDECGDIILDASDRGGSVLVDLIVDQSIKCVDTNNNGNLDFSVCFSWREADTDDLCTLRVDDPNKRGALPDVYPSDMNHCFCTTYDVPGIKVVKLVEEDKTVPCL